LQELAKSIDYFEETGIHTHAAKSYVQEFLSNQDPEVPPTATPFETAFLGQMFLGYQILDTLLWVEGWPTHNLLTPVNALTKPSCTPKRLEAVIKSLGRPPPIVSKTLIGHEDSPESTPCSALSPSPVLEAALKNMHNATICNRKAEYQDILSQIYAAAFVMAWFKPVSCKLQIIFCGSHVFLSLSCRLHKWT
jgi:hypothetical protein